MQTHRDSDFEPSPTKTLAEQIAREETAKNQVIISHLEQKAAEMTAKGESEITTGRSGERVLATAQRHGVQITRLPDDEDCLRISIGKPIIGPGEEKPKISCYLVIRGDPEACADLLARADWAFNAACPDLNSDST